MDGHSPERKERLTFCQEEFDFSEEDSALNKNISKKKNFHHAMAFWVSKQEWAELLKAMSYGKSEKLIQWSILV